MFQLLGSHFDFFSQPLHCTNGRCTGSVMFPYGGEIPSPRPAGTPRPKDEVKVHAQDFLQQYYTSINLWVPNMPRSMCQYSKMTPRFPGQDRKLLKFLLSLKTTPPNTEVCPESLGAMLEYWFMERGQLMTCFSLTTAIARILQLFLSSNKTGQ